MTLSMLKLTAVVLAVLAWGAHAHAVVVPLPWDSDTHWQGPPGQTRDWFDTANWTNGLPGNTTRAYIENRGAARIDAGLAEAYSLRVQSTLGSSLTQTGGQLEIDASLAVVDGAKYELHGGVLRAGSVNVHDVNGPLILGLPMEQFASRFIQTGGQAEVEGSLSVGGFWTHVVLPPPGEPFPLEFPPPTTEMPEYPAGRYEMIGGLLTTGTSSVGQSGHGLFSQMGGRHTTDTLIIGGPEPYLWALPDLILGGLSPHVMISPSETGVLPLPGRIVQVWPRQPTKGTYALAGGELMATQMRINPTGTLTQTGGSQQVGYMEIDAGGGKLVYRGGLLELDYGLALNGELDFAGSSAVLHGGSGIYDFSKGVISNAQHAGIKLGAGSLAIVAAGADPSSQLGLFETDGMVHVAGNDLTIGADQQVVNAWGRIDDHVTVAGRLTAVDTADVQGRVDLGAGLMVEDGGVVSLGQAGQLDVRDSRSGIRGGELRAGSVRIGSASFLPPEGSLPLEVVIHQGDFVHSAGDVTIGRDLGDTQSATARSPPGRCGSDRSTRWPRRQWPHSRRRADTLSSSRASCLAETTPMHTPTSGLWCRWLDRTSPRQPARRRTLFPIQDPGRAC